MISGKHKPMTCSQGPSPCMLMVMDPNQQPGHDPYAFITAAPQKQKKTLIPAPTSRKQRLILVGAGFTILLILLMVGFAIFSNIRSSGSKTLLGVAQSQQEIIRVSELGVRNSRDSATQGFAQSVALSLSSSQKELVTYLDKQGVKAGTKELGLKKDATTDKTLDTASQASRYDETLKETLKKELLEYQKEVKTVYDQSDSASAKKILQDSFNQVNVLLKNVN